MKLELAIRKLHLTSFKNATQQSAINQWLIEQIFDKKSEKRWQCTKEKDEKYRYLLNLTKFVNFGWIGDGRVCCASLSCEEACLSC